MDWWQSNINAGICNPSNFSELPRATKEYIGPKQLISYSTGPREKIKFNSIGEVLDNIIMNSNQFSTVQEYDEAIFAQMDRVSDGFMCKICSFKRGQRHFVKEHIEIHFRVTFTCPNCFKHMKSRSSLRAHWIKTHGPPKI